MAAHGVGRGASRGVGETLILKRRQRDDTLAHYTECVKGFNKMNARAEWEQTLAVKADTVQVQRTVKHLRNQQESQLHSRRLRLAELYNSEMEAWKEACLANVETPEDRKQQMIQRALELKQRRERERLALAEEKRMQHYRPVSDLWVSLQRKFEEKMAQLWYEDRLKKEERERRDRELAAKRDAEVKAILDLQVDLVKKRRQTEEENKQTEDRELLEEWERLKFVEDELERQRKMNDIQRAMDVKQFNQERVEASRAAAEREREYDRRLLELALAQEAETKRLEREQQEKFKQDQLEYQHMLKKQMEMEAEDLSFLDKIRQDMENQVWAKRDAQHNAEEAARQELLRQVIESRNQQMELKREQQIKHKHDDIAYMEQLKRETEEALQKELREQEERRLELKRTQSELLRQQEERRIADEQKRQAEYLELKRMQLAEKKHKERVSQFASQVPSTNYRRKTAQWYFDA
ncbi:hypothetical protein ATCC90586_010165 [Pythium insidiosum]|nr:hypothetical protein ATCC90586_010165 [Pythium insidiosum]